MCCLLACSVGLAYDHPNMSHHQGLGMPWTESARELLMKSGLQASLVLHIGAYIGRRASAAETMLTGTLFPLHRLPCALLPCADPEGAAHPGPPDPHD